MTKRKAPDVKSQDLSASDTAMDPEDTIEDRHHTTQDEMKFLDDLGTYQSHFAEFRCNSGRSRPVTTPLTKVGWLGAYIRASATRQEWGDVDEREVLQYATDLLRSLLRKAQATRYGRRT